MNVYQLLNFIWMIHNVQMQTVEDKTVISALRWYAFDRHRLQLRSVVSVVTSVKLLSFPVWVGACHGPDRLQKGPHASRIGWVDVVSRWTCLHVRRAAKKKMLCRFVISAVRTHWRMLSSDTVQVAGRKRAVAHSQLGNSDTLSSGQAKSPVCLRIGLSSQVQCVAECGSRT